MLKKDGKRSKKNKSKPDGPQLYLKLQTRFIPYLYI